MQQFGSTVFRIRCNVVTFYELDNLSPVSRTATAKEDRFTLGSRTLSTVLIFPFTSIGYVDSYVAPCAKRSAITCF